MSAITSILKSIINIIESLWNLVIDRLHLREFLEHPVPRYSNLNPLYWFGDVAAMSFFILAATGFILALGYVPSLDIVKVPKETFPEPLLHPPPGNEVIMTEAYYSVFRIMYQTPMGFIVRELHFWAAYMMIFSALVHFYAKFVLGSYKRRGGGALWVIGVILGVLTITQAVLGYTLTMHLDGALAIQIGANIFRYFDYLGIPIGGLMVAILGTNFLTTEMISKVFALHIVIVPALILILLGLKLQGILYGGVVQPPVEDRRVAERALADKEPFYPHRFALTVGQLFLQLSVLLLLVALFPLPLLDPWYPGMETPPGVRPPWPVMFYYTYVKMIDPFISVGIPIIMAVFALLVPLIDRSRSNSLEDRWIWILIATVFMAIIGYGTVLGYLVDIPKEVTPLTRIALPPEQTTPYINISSVAVS